MSATYPPPSEFVLIPIISRKVKSIGTLTLTAQTMAAIRKVKFNACMRGVRPYNSLRGDTKSGPTARPITKIEMSRGPSAWLVECKSLMACGTPGAKIVDDMALELCQHGIL